MKNEISPKNCPMICGTPTCMQMMPECPFRAIGEIDVDLENLLETVEFNFRNFDRTEFSDEITDFVNEAIRTAVLTERARVAEES